YLSVAGIDGELRRARLSTAPIDADSSNIVELFARTAAAPAHRSVPMPWRVAAATVACLLAVLLFVAVRAAWYERSIETGPGEWKTVALADGSELQLGPNTRLQLNLD